MGHILTTMVNTVNLVVLCLVNSTSTRGATSFRNFVAAAMVIVFSAL